MRVSDRRWLVRGVRGLPRQCKVNPTPFTLNPQPSTLNPKPQTLNRKPQTLDSAVGGSAPGQELALLAHLFALKAFRGTHTTLFHCLKLVHTDLGRVGARRAGPARTCRRALGVGVPVAAPADLVPPGHAQHAHVCT